MLIERRNAIARVWLNGVNPVVGPRLAADGTLTFENAAVAAGAATPGTGYTVSWSRFDNGSRKAEVVGDSLSRDAGARGRRRRGCSPVQSS